MDQRTSGESGWGHGVLGVDTDVDAETRVADRVAVRRLAAWRSDRILQTLLLLIGVHSCVLGLVMLFAPRFMLSVFGFDLSLPIFFPSQSGVFLLILGLCYLLALIDPPFVKVIFISKAFAVLFLFTHAALLSAPLSIWAAGAGDATMLAVLIAALSRHRRLTSDTG